jgi:hypothetical protein
MKEVLLTKNKQTKHTYNLHRSHIEIVDICMKKSWARMRVEYVITHFKISDIEVPFYHYVFTHLLLTCCSIYDSMTRKDIVHRNYKI